MWCHMGQSCDTLHLPQISEGDVKVMAAAFLCLNPLFPYLCFSYLSTFVLFVVVRTPQSPEFNLCTIISPFFFFAYFLPMQLVLLYSHLTIVAKSVELFKFTTLGQAEGFKNDIALGVFVSRQQQTQSTLPSHEV